MIAAAVISRDLIMTTTRSSAQSALGLQRRPRLKPSSAAAAAEG
jgi:hypothetical protein